MGTDFPEVPASSWMFGMCLSNSALVFGELGDRMRSSHWKKLCFPRKMSKTFEML